MKLNKRIRKQFKRHLAIDAEKKYQYKRLNGIYYHTHGIQADYPYYIDLHTVRVFKRSSSLNE